MSYRVVRRWNELDQPDLPDATVTVAHGGQTGLKSFYLKTYSSPQFTHKWRSSLFLKILSDEAVTESSGK